MLAGGSALNFFLYHVHALSREKLDNLVTVDGLVHVFVKHTVLLQRVDAAVICFNGPESQRHGVEIRMRDYTQEGVGICVRGPRGHQVLVDCKFGAVFVVLAKRIKNKKGKRGEKRGEREEGREKERDSNREI